MTQHEKLLGEVIKAILAVATDDSVCAEITNESLMDLENIAKNMMYSSISRPYLNAPSQSTTVWLNSAPYWFACWED
jgi:hypothetical protein